MSLKTLEKGIKAYLKNISSPDNNIGEVQVKNKNGVLFMYFDGGGYEHFSYTSVTAEKCRGEIETIAKKNGYQFQDRSNCSFSFWEE